MAKVRDESDEDLRRRLLETQVRTAEIGLEQAEQNNETYQQTKQQRATQNKQRQTILATEAARRDALQRDCLHKQGGGPEDRYEGDGKSCLTLSRVFFSNNFLIQCNRCDLALQRPHPKLKSPKPLYDGETKAKIEARIAQYNEDVKRYEGLIREAKGNKLRPMLGPTWEYVDEEGRAFIPDWE